MDRALDGNALESILERIAALEQRLTRLEKAIEPLAEARGESMVSPVEPTAADAEETLHREQELEAELGQNWFAKTGILVIAIGIAFLLTFPYSGVPAILPSAFGVVLVLGAVWLSRFWRDSYPQISRTVLGGSLLLLYFTALRLYFFSAAPPVTDRTIETLLLFAVSVVTTTVALRSNSVVMTGFSLTTGHITALVAGTPWAFALLCTLSAIAAVQIVLRRNWPRLLLPAALMTLATQLLWVLGNPVLGNTIQLRVFDPWSALPLLVYSAIYSLGTLLRNVSESKEKGLVVVDAFTIVPFFYALMLAVSIAGNAPSLPLYHTAASILFLAISIAFWKREESKYSTFVYAMQGYMALSVAIIAEFERPDYFIWLSWQSLIVISTAVWFRSQFIVITNFFIFLTIFVAYAVLAGTANVISISFGIVALASARILNWQKERLALKTDRMRDAYLASAFFIFPYAMYHALPPGLVSLSWVGIALFYFAMSILLRSHKYRWMALATLCLTIGRVFIVDIVNLDPTLRIISLLVVGSVLLWVSMVYARKKRSGDGGSSLENIREEHNVER